jgi:hypothetical protein
MVSVTRRNAQAQVLEMEIDRLGGDVQALRDLPHRQALLEEGGYLLPSGQ